MPVNRIAEFISTGSREEALHLIETGVLNETEIDFVYNLADAKLIFALVSFQEITEQVIYHTFHFRNIEIVQELLELIEGEVLPDELLAEVFAEESYREVRKVVGYAYPLLKPAYVLQLIQQDRNLSYILDLIRYQTISPEIIDYLLNDHTIDVLVQNQKNIGSFEDAGRVRELLLENLICYHQPLPEKLVTWLMEEKIFVHELIDCQQLDEHWLLHLLNDPSAEHLHHELLRRQQLTDHVIDFIFSEKPLLVHSLVRAHALNKQQIERALSSGVANIIEGTLTYQHFSPEEMETLRDRFPKYKKALASNAEMRKVLWGGENLKRRRNHDLEKKRRFVESNRNAGNDEVV